MSDSKSTQRYDVYFSGRVQGVGFRYTSVTIAEPLAVTGYVMNLADGRVRLVAEGTREELDKLVGKIDQQLGNYIDDQHMTCLPPTGEFAAFHIRY